MIYHVFQGMPARKEECVGRFGCHVEGRHSRNNFDTDSCYFSTKPHLIEFF